MAYLICDHCQHANELTTRYLTFCQSCGKKITNNFSSWSKENPGRSFAEFSNSVARTSIIRWERESTAKESAGVSHSRAITFAAASLLMTLVVLTGLSDLIADTMNNTGFLDFFTTYNTLEAGLQALQSD